MDLFVFDEETKSTLLDAGRIEHVSKFKGEE
jgi:hypothetical protein